MKYRKYKIIIFVKKNLIILILAALVATLTSGYALYKVSEPVVMISEADIPFYSIKAKYDGYAVVESENSIWNVNATLKDKPKYILRVAPNLSVTFDFEIYAKNLSDVSILKKTDVILHSKLDDGYIWSVVYLENTSQIDGSSISDTITIDVRDAWNSMVAIERAIGYENGEKSIEVITLVKFEGKADGFPFSGVRTYRLPIAVDGNTYTFEGFNRTEDVTRTVSKKITVQPTLTKKMVPAIALITSASVLGFLITVGIKFKPEKDVLERIMLERKFKKRISYGRLKNIEITTKIELESLEDLFNVAVDTNERIIYDVEREGYFIIHNNVLYTYKPRILNQPNDEG